MKILYTFVFSIFVLLTTTSCGDSVQRADAPAISVAPQTVLFDGRINEGDTDLQELLIENGGSGALVISDVQIRGHQSFSVVSGFDGELVRIEPDDSWIIRLGYAGVEDGIPTGTLILTHNDFQSEGETRVPLRITESAPRLYVTPNPINFGRVPAGGHSSISASISNIGGRPLLVSDYFIIGGNGVFVIPEDQLLDPTSGEGLELEADESQTITINYDPVDDGFDTGVMIVRSNDPSTADGNTEVEILANGAEPCIEVVPNNEGTYDFGERIVGRTAEETFTIQNCSDPTFGETLIVSSIDLDESSSGAYELSNLPTLPMELLPAEERAFVVGFTPIADLQVESGLLEIDSNDAYTPEIDIELNGIGTTNECPIARAACTVQGSSLPPVSDLFVEPLDTLTCSAVDSTDVDGDIIEYIWSVAEAPEGSTAEFLPDNASETSFFVDLAGRYVLNLEVVDDRGCISDPSTVSVVARPGEDIHVQLIWTTPTDPDETDVGFGAGTDLDLHLVHPNGCWESVFWDCHFRSREPNWGDPGTASDDPSLDIDDTDGAGPENINLDNPETGVTYKVGVHYYNDHGYGASYATLRLYFFGELIFEAREKEFPYADVWWEALIFSWPPDLIGSVDRMWDGVPPCP